jgi:hypothetical protein
MDNKKNVVFQCKLLSFYETSIKKDPLLEVITFSVLVPIPKLYCSSTYPGNPIYIKPVKLLCIIDLPKEEVRHFINKDY